MAKTGDLYIISAPSGAGKTSLVKALVEKVPNLYVSVSHTTRPIRSGEKAGENYYFIHKNEFEGMLEKNKFLEHAEVFGNYYGTSRSFVEEALKKGDDVILEIDWQGARQVRIQFSNAISIFVLPPSIEELNTRLMNRLQDNVAIIDSRMKEAKQELSRYTEYDYLVCNDNFEEALLDLISIIRCNRLRYSRQRYNLSELLVKLTG